MKIPGIALLWMNLLLLSCSPDVAERADALRQNVVRIAADGAEGVESGFGFITGQKGSSLYITTAAHVVAEANGIRLSFHAIREAKAATLVFVDTDYDIAVLRVDNPPPFTWYKNCLGEGRASDDVGFIGKNGVTRGKEIGSIRDFGLNVINCYLPTVSVGTSGAPLVHDSGFIGMIVFDEATTTQAVDMNTIRQLLETEESAYFQLKRTGFRKGATETDPGLSDLEKDIADFKTADEIGTVESYRKYLADYEEGKFREQALKRLEELLQKAETSTLGQQSEDAANSPVGGDREVKMTSNGDFIEIVDKDGNRYPTKLMKDGQRWMIQNLSLQVEKSWCYNQDTINCAKYGRLYTWEAAKQACAELGAGWRLPTDEEWRRMVKQYGGVDDDAQDKGRAAYLALSGTGRTGFAAQLGGWRRPNGDFSYLGLYGDYWSASSYRSSRAWRYGFDQGNGQLYRNNDYRNFGHSVRCLQDSVYKD